MNDVSRRGGVYVRVCVSQADALYVAQDIAESCWATCDRPNAIWPPNDQRQNERGTAGGTCINYGDRQAETLAQIRTHVHKSHGDARTFLSLSLPISVSICIKDVQISRD